MEESGIFMNKNAVNENEENSTFSTIVFPSSCKSLQFEETTSNFQERDPLENILEFPGSRIHATVKKDVYKELLTDIPEEPRILVMFKEEASFQEAEEPLSDPLAIDPLNVNPSQTLNQNIKNEKKVQNLDSNEKKEAKEEILTGFPVVIVPSVFRSEETLNSQEDPLADIPDVPVIARKSSLVKNETSLQKSEAGEPVPISEIECMNELSLLERDEERIEELGTQSSNESSSDDQNPRSSEELNTERRARKSAVAALASIHHNRITYGTDISDGEDGSDADEDYHLDSESDDSEEEAPSRSKKRKINTFPISPSPVPPSRQAESLAETTAPASPLNSPASTALPPLRHQSSCACSENPPSGTVQMPFHFSHCSLFHPVTHCQTLTAPNQQVQHRISSTKGSSGQLNHLHSSDPIPKQIITLDTRMIAKNIVLNGPSSDLQGLYIHNKRTSILKSGIVSNATNHSGEFVENREQLEPHKMPTKERSVQQLSLITDSAHRTKDQLFTLPSREQFLSRSINNNFKESVQECHNKSPRNHINFEGRNHCDLLGDKVVPSRTKDCMFNLVKIIIHPTSGLLVTQISYITNNNNSNKSSIQYECHKCKQIFTSEQYQQTHNAPNSAGKQSFTCHKCGKVINLHNELDEHYKQHTRSDKALTCPICGQSLATKKSLKYHLLHRHSSKRPYTCKICSRTFKTNSCLRSHSKVHSDVKPIYKCSECSKSFMSKSAFGTHTRIHKGIIPIVKCQICNKICLKRGFKRHLDVHSSERNSQCNICDKKFVSDARLKMHILYSHSGKSGIRHVCDICGKAMRSFAALRDHMNIHSGEKPYTCHICGKNFSVYNRLNYHLKIHDEKNLKCDMCGYTCNRMDNLITHIRSHTGEKPYRCSLCNKAFTRSDNLQTHKRLSHKLLSS